MSEDLDQAGEIAAAICAGAVRALRRRAERQAAISHAGTATAEGRPDVLIRSGEAAIALRLAGSLNACADELETWRLP